MDEFSVLHPGVKVATLRASTNPVEAASRGRQDAKGSALPGDEASPVSLTGEAVPHGRQLVEALATLADVRIGGSEVFGTYTFRDPPPSPGSPGYTSVGHAGAVRAMSKYLVGLAEVYPGIAAFVAMEPHADRVAPHFHSLLGGLGSDVAAAVERGRTAGRGTLQGPGGRSAPSSASLGSRHATERLWHAWYVAHGMARLEAVRGDGSALYVAKYSLKGGDAVPWWAIWEPGQLRNEWVEGLRRRRRT